MSMATQEAGYLFEGIFQELGKDIYYINTSTKTIKSQLTTPQ